MSTAPVKCHKCGKTVYHAESVRHEGLIFHNICFSIWNKETKAKEQEERNKRDYLPKADVSPAYYRVADPATGTPAQMVSGTEERPTPTTTTTATVAAPPTEAKIKCKKCGNEIESKAKFCPECGEKNEPPAPAGCKKCGFVGAKGKFCSECGGSL